MKLCLGTVQLGMNYGVKKESKPSLDQCIKMLKISIDNGIEIIDTAFMYGEAEEIIGKFFKVYPKYKARVKIISKLKPNILESVEKKDIYKVIKDNLFESLKLMGVESLEGYLFHTPDYIYNQEALNSLVKLKAEGYIKNIGVSIYEEKEALYAVQHKDINFIQYPYSILDQRLDKTDFFKLAKKNDKILFSRSAFLQGLLLMDLKDVPDYLKGALKDLEKIKSYSKRYQIDILTACIDFIKLKNEADYFVLGVNTSEQLIEDIKLFNSDKKMNLDLLNELKNDFNSIDKSIVMPSLWSKNK